MKRPHLPAADRMTFVLSGPRPQQALSLAAQGGVRLFHIRPLQGGFRALDIATRAQTRPGTAAGTSGASTERYNRHDMVCSVDGLFKRFCLDDPVRRS